MRRAEDDPLGPARGVVYGLIAGLALWVLASWLSKLAIALFVTP
jgi:hypothetical protein